MATDDKYLEDQKNIIVKKFTDGVISRDQATDALDFIETQQLLNAKKKLSDRKSQKKARFGRSLFSSLVAITHALVGKWPDKKENAS